MLFSTKRLCRQRWRWQCFPFPSSFSSSSLSPLFPTMFSVNSLQFIFCCCSPFFSHSSHVFLNAVLPSHSQPSSTHFPSIFWVSALYLCRILSTRQAHTNLLLVNFSSKLWSTPTPTLTSSILLLAALLTPTILLAHLLSQTCIFFCFCVCAILLQFHLKYTLYYN